jgi:hypothetical protein
MNTIFDFPDRSILATAASSGIGLFLLSDAASMISGITLPIDGGYTAR